MVFGSQQIRITNKPFQIRSELYYKDVTITQKQENVAEALKIICCLLDKTPWKLGVMSSSKGIISGPLQIHLPEHLIVDCSIHKTGTIYFFIRHRRKPQIPSELSDVCWVYFLLGMTLPHFTADIGTIITTAEYVLVVEKDTVFKKLVQCNIMERWNQKCIMITVSKSIFIFKPQPKLKPSFHVHRVEAIRT